MAEELESILRRVASGELTPEEAEPLVAAATTARGDAPPRESGTRGGSGAASARSEPSGGGRGAWSSEHHAGQGGPPRRTVRLQVLEGGRAVVNLRIPMTWAGLAGSVLPGLSAANAERIRDAIRSGEVGTILEVHDQDGGGVVISTE
jgi:hypothetical protein